MKLWLLKATDEAANKDLQGYDTYDSFVVRAKTEKEARELAQKADSSWRGSTLWIDPILSTCESLKYDGESGVILGSFNAG